MEAAESSGAGRLGGAGIRLPPRCRATVVLACLTAPLCRRGDGGRRRGRRPDAGVGDRRRRARDRDPRRRDLRGRGLRGWSAAPPASWAEVDSCGQRSGPSVRSSAAASPRPLGTVAEAGFSAATSRLSAASRSGRPRSCTSVRTDVSTAAGASARTVRSTRWRACGDRLYVGGSFAQARRRRPRQPGRDRRPLRRTPRLGPQGRRPDEGRPGRGVHDRAYVRRERDLLRRRLRPRRRRAATVARRGRDRRHASPSTPVRATRTRGRRRGRREERGVSVSIVSIDPRGRALYAAGDFDDARRCGASGARRRGRADGTRPRRGTPTATGTCGRSRSLRRGLRSTSPASSPRSEGSRGAGWLRSTPASGSATLWDPGVGGAVHAIALDASAEGRRLPVASSSPSETSIAPTSPPWTRVPASATPWDVPVVGTVDVVEPRRSRRHGREAEIESVGALRRNGLAALTADGSTVTDWQPPIRGIVRALASDAQHGRVYVGGRFSLEESRTQRSLATLDVASGTLSAWGPTVNSGVWAIAPPGTARPSTWAARSRPWTGRPRQAAGARSGPATARCCPGTSVRAPSSATLSLERRGTLGRAASSRRSAASSAGVSPPSRSRAPRRRAGMPTANGNVESLAVIGETVYVAGPFTAIGGRSRKHLAALDAGDGAATRWDPAPDDVVRALAARA